MRPPAVQERVNGCRIEYVVVEESGAICMTV
jgi:hypothetical protein